MDGRELIATTSSKLKNIEKFILQLLDDSIAVHVLDELHRCTTDVSMDIFLSNRHPTIKHVRTRKDMKSEFGALNLVLWHTYGEILHTFCPMCGEQTFDS